MPSKQALFENIEQYTADELLRYIREGLVTFDELCDPDNTQGYFPADVRKELGRKLSLTPVSQPATETTIFDHQPPEPEPPIFPGLFPGSTTPPTPPTPPTPAPQAADPWGAVDKENADSLRRFIHDYPDSPHIRDARKTLNHLLSSSSTGAGLGAGLDLEALLALIQGFDTQRNEAGEDDLIAVDSSEALYNKLTEMLDKRRIDQQLLLDALATDSNLLNSKILSRLLDEGYLDLDSLQELGIDSRFLVALGNRRPDQFPAPRRLDKINKMSTEVYFWGIPSSGKSCVLGAVLSVAGNGQIARTMFRDNDCQGYGYMNILADLFRGDGRVGILPPGTPKTATYEMAFDLVDHKGKYHPITCIDLAGEVIRMMYKSDAGMPMSPSEMDTLETVTNLLIDNRSVNRKTHFFVLEYGGERRQYEGLTQRTYLEGALQYIRRFKIFEKETDAIYLLITKVDKTGKEGQELRDELRTYINDGMYRSFYQGLQQICQECEINGGLVEILPFTLGQVCFKDYCLFDDRCASNVVHRLMERSKGFDRSKMGKFASLFKN